MGKFPINRDVLIALQPKSHLVGAKTEQLVGKTFTLLDAVAPERNQQEFDLSDNTKDNARQARFRYVDEDGNPFIITIGALLYTDVIINKDKDVSTVIDLMLSEGDSNLFIPQSFTIATANKRLWENGTEKFPAYMYEEFQRQRSAGKTFEELITNYDFVNKLQFTGVAERYKSRDCLKDIVFSKIVFKA